jgi:MazG family protein
MSQALDELRATIARLRAPGGCPWDIEQTHQSLVRCLIDECAELVDTIDRLDYPHMREELGDVLIQVVFHAQIAEEHGRFDLDAVAREVNEKLIRRHPHVFGDHAKLGTAGDVIVKWEEIKAQEKKNGPAESGPFKPQPPSLPATMLAEAVWKQVEKKNLSADGVVDVPRVQALAADLTAEALGRALFELCAAARARGLDAEGALRHEAKRVMAGIEARLGAQTPA